MLAMNSDLTRFAISPSIRAVCSASRVRLRSKASLRRTEYSLIRVFDLPAPIVPPIMIELHLPSVILGQAIDQTITRG